jgi:hypothetical protein
MRERPVLYPRLLKAVTDFQGTDYVQSMLADLYFILWILDYSLIGLHSINRSKFGARVYEC